MIKKAIVNGIRMRMHVAQPTVNGPRIVSLGVFEPIRPLLYLYLHPPSWTDLCSVFCLEPDAFNHDIVP